MSNKRVLIRVDASDKIGLGHLVRCRALAEMLKGDFLIKYVFKVISKNIVEESKLSDGEYCILKEDCELLAIIKEGEDIVVLDGYHFDVEYQKSIRHAGSKLVCIDDMHDKSFDADLIINHGPGISPKDYSDSNCVKFGLGHKYLLLRSPFQSQMRNVRSISEVKKLLIIFGGSDTMGLSIALLKKGIGAYFSEVNIVFGTASAMVNCPELSPQSNIKFHFNLCAEDIVALAKTCQLAICSSSGISYELACIGIGLVVCQVSDNQIHFFNFFKDKSLARGFSFLKNKNIDDLIEIVIELSKSVMEINQQIKLQKLYFNQPSQKMLLQMFTSL